EFSGREVIEEKQRFRAAAEYIVDAHRNQVDADGVVFFQRERKLQFRAHAVGRRDQNRLGVLRKIMLKKRAETTQPAEYSGRKGALRVRLDTRNEFVAGFDIHAGGGISCGNVHLKNSPRRTQRTRSFFKWRRKRIYPSPFFLKTFASFASFAVK